MIANLLHVENQFEIMKRTIEDTEQPASLSEQPKRKSRFESSAEESSASSSSSVNLPPHLHIPSVIKIEGGVKNVVEIKKEVMIDAAAMQAQLAAQIASVSSMLQTVQQQQQAAIALERKAAFRPLLLDSAGTNNTLFSHYYILNNFSYIKLAPALTYTGREIDEFGNLKRQEHQVKTLAANVFASVAQKKKENPYLAHRLPAAAVTVGGMTSAMPLGLGTDGLLLGAEAGGAGGMEEGSSIDRTIGSSRAIRGRRALRFVETGRCRVCVSGQAAKQCTVSGGKEPQFKTVIFPPLPLSNFFVLLWVLVGNHGNLGLLIHITNAKNCSKPIQSSNILDIGSSVET